VQRTSDDWGLNLITFKPRDTNKTNYLIEPDREALVSVIALLLLKMILYHALVRSKASVESARALAMKNATDAAADMGQGLSLIYNQLRQGKITNEIAEISAGQSALA
jgi:F-type H+-transporting ATPase subunit gamma